MKYTVLWAMKLQRTIKVTALCKAWTVFARSDGGIMGSNLTQDLDVCLFFVFVVLYIGKGAGQEWPQFQ
jgi:hypothetical protein